MEHKNNTGSSASSNMDLIHLANDVMPDFKNFLKNNFPFIIINEIEDLNKNFNQIFTSVAHTYPTDGKDCKYDYLCYAISLRVRSIKYLSFTEYVAKNCINL